MREPLSTLSNAAYVAAGIAIAAHGTAPALYVGACVVALGLYLTGAKDAAIYDGSWAEWGSRDDTPIVTGS